MRARASYVAVGLFVLLLGAGLIAGILWLTTGGPPRNYDFFHVYMSDSVSGLSIDAPVKYKGVNRGRVREIVLDPDNPELVRLLLVVLEGTPVTTETLAVLEYSGLTGVASINLSGGRKDSPRLETRPGDEYPVIRSKPSLLARLDESVSEVLASFIETSNRLNLVLDERNRNAIAEMLENATLLVGELTRRTQELDTLMANVDGLVTDLRESSNGLPDVFEQFAQSADALETMADTLAQAGNQMRDTGAAMQQTLEASGEDLAEFTAGTLPEAAVLVADLRLAAQNLRRTSESLARDPRVLLFGPPEPAPGPGEERRQ